MQRGEGVVGNPRQKHAQNRVCRLFSYTYRRWLLMLSSPLRFCEIPLREYTQYRAQTDP